MSQTIEEYLVDRKYYDYKNEAYIARYFPEFSRFQVYINGWSTGRSVKSIIRMIKTSSHRVNKNLFSELVKLFPEHMI